MIDRPPTPIGLPPKCGMSDCENYVSTNRDGYNLKCDECLHGLHKLPEEGGPPQSTI